jgi:hypothetical protein
VILGPRHLIGGSTSGEGETFDSRSTRDSSVLARAPIATPEVVDRAVAAARGACWETGRCASGRRWAPMPARRTGRGAAHSKPSGVRPVPHHPVAELPLKPDILIEYTSVGPVVIDATHPVVGGSAVFAGSGRRRLVGDDEDRQLRILDQS